MSKPSILVLILTDRQSANERSLALSLLSRFEVVRTPRTVVAMDSVPEIATMPAIDKNLVVKIGRHDASKQGIEASVDFSGVTIHRFTVNHKHGVKPEETETISGYMAVFPAKVDLGQGVVDLRSDSARARAQRAETALETEDEEIAQELTRLSKELLAQEAEARQQWPNKFSPFSPKIKKIGELLCANGGSGRMDLICYRVNHLCKTSYFIRRNWDGICDWSYN